MPLLFAPLVGAALGALLAWLARAELLRHAGPVASSRGFAVAAAFATFVVLPVTAYFAAFHGDWGYLYLVPWRKVPSAVDLVLVVASAGAVLAGFAAAARPARAERHGTVLAFVTVPGGAVAVMAVAAQRRLATSGTYKQFHGDFGTEPIATGALGRSVLFMALVVVLGVAWAAFCLRARPDDAQGRR